MTDQIEEIEGEEDEQNVTPVETILAFLANPDNIADMIEEEILEELGAKVSERIQADEESMSDWKALVDWGIEVKKVTTQPLDRMDGGSFDNSANFKSPIMTEAALKWSDRASTEILKDKDIAKSRIIVEAPKPQPKPEMPEIPPDATPEQQQQIQQQMQQVQQQASKQEQQLSTFEAIKEKGERVSTHLNYQINWQMDWLDPHIKLLYELPNIGMVFKKTFYDPIEKTNVTGVIHYPDFIVNKDATNLEEWAFTECMIVSKNQTLTNQRMGIWSDVSLSSNGNEELTVDGKTNTETEDADEFDSSFYEHQGWYDLDDDGYEEPYIITIHKSTSKVVRIVPRYDSDDVFIMNETGTLVSLEDVIQAQAESGSEEEPDFDGVEIVKITGLNIYTKYGFIPSDDGSYFDRGYYHLLGHLVSLINKATNLMINAGTLANQPSGLLSAAFRRAKNVLRMNPGEFKQTDMQTEDLQTGIYTFPFKGADPTLMQLMQDITQQARQLSSSIDMASVLGTNTPASTTLALLHENMVSSSAALIRTYRSMGEELELLALLNQKHTDKDKYQQIVGDIEADHEIDYSEENVSVIPIANPEVSSKMERIQLAEVVISQIPIIKEVGGNVVKVLKDFFDAVGYDSDAVFEQTEGEASAAQKIEMQQQEIAKKGQEQHQQQLDMLSGQQEIEKGNLEISKQKQELEQQKQDFAEQIKSAELSQKLDMNEEELALKGEEQDRKNEETAMKGAALPAEINLKVEQAHKAHEEALNEGSTDDRDG